ncbi:TolC family outer membrane protein [Thiomicrospira sp. WB1]|uniref:TolC family outer membrane protein n=1 Tax=Thiomicrospira sp. WB1 TaxID=1685380 RepID=UPI001F485185|nr:TolC family outer membrane protein [Thiomicrospira sp. WB1]
MKHKTEQVGRRAGLKTWVMALGLAGWGMPAQSATGLMDVYQMAVTHDAQLAQARAQFEADRRVVEINRAPLLPQLSADADVTRQDSDLKGRDNTRRQAGLSLTQTLYRKDQFARYDQADFQRQQAQFALQEAEQSVIERVTDAYFKVLLSLEEVRLAKARESSDKTQWERAQASADVGLASKTDVLQAKSSFDLSRSQRISAENDLDVAKEELMKLTGQPVSELKEIRLDTRLNMKPVDVVTWEAKAESNNLTVLQSQQAASAASKAIEVQQSGHWVSVDLRGQYQHQSYADYEEAYASSYQDSNALSVGVYASLPLYAGGGTSAKVAQARASYQAANQSLRNAKESARLNARVQARNLERGLELVRANRAAVVSNDAFLEAAEEGYKVGLRNMLEVLTARTNMFQARRNLAESLHNVVLSRLRLEAAAGSLTADTLQRFERLLSAPRQETVPTVTLDGDAS